MSRRHGFLIFSIILALLWLSLLLPRGSWPEVLLHPWRQLWGSGQQLNATLLEASEGEAVRSVSHRLFKPLGDLKVLHVYDADDKPKS